MSKIWIITLLGLFTALVPFLGFPGPVRTLLVVVLGLGVAGLSLRMFIAARYSNQAFLHVFKDKPKVGEGIVAPPPLK